MYPGGSRTGSVLSSDHSLLTTHHSLRNARDRTPCHDPRLLRAKSVIFVLHRDVRIRRSAGMRARSLAARRLRRRGTLRCAVLLRASPWVSIHGHPLGGAKHASLKDTAEPMYPGGSRKLSLVLTTHYSRLTQERQASFARLAATRCKSTPTGIRDLQSSMAEST